MQTHQSTSTLVFSTANLPAAHTLSRNGVLFLAARLATHFSNKSAPEPSRLGSRYLLKTEVYDILVVSNTESAIYKRLSCKRFWRRSLEKKVNEERLSYEARNALVGGQPKNDMERVQNYCSDKTLKREQMKRKDNEEKMSRYKVVNTKTKEEESLLTIALSNERNRVNELYFTAKSLEKLANENNLKWMFVTLTAPPRYHPNPLKGNRSYDLTVGIKGSHEYIKGLWVKIRSILARRGVNASPSNYFGFRTVEPHKDGSIHWHLLIFCSEVAQEKIATAISEKFPGKHAAEIIYGKEGYGCASAATYLYKYIAKSVSKDASTHHGVQESAEDEIREGNDLASLRNKERVQAALKALGIRQYQIFGVCNLTTIFKKINRLDLQVVDPPQDSILGLVKAKIWRNPDGYLNMIKNAEIFTSGSDIQLIKEPALTSYGEPTKKIVGIMIGASEFRNDSTYRIVRA